MDFINEKKVHYSLGPCASCGSFALPAKAAHHKDEMLLCTSCLEERHTIIDDMRANVRKQFDLDRSPKLRSCFLRMLLTGEVDLTPGGWRAGMALGFELKDAGFAPHESRQILLQAKANSNMVDKLVDNIYRKNGKCSLACEQIRVLNVTCDQCPGQYRMASREQCTEIC